MRTPVVLALAALTTLGGAWAQQAPANEPTTDRLVARLTSDDEQARNEALEFVRTHPAALRDVRVALVDQLDQENHEPPSKSGEDEGYAEYLGWLTQAVAEVVDWSDQRQVCILADSLLPFDELADHAKASVPCLLQKYKTVPGQFRGLAVAMLVQALAKGKSDLDAPTVSEIREIILSALRNPDHNIKGDTIRALGKFGAEDMIPALRATADAETSNDAGSRSIRRRTLQAIADIQKRTGKN